MPQISTVLGPVDVDRIERVMIHEHLYIDLSHPGDPDAKLTDTEAVVTDAAALRSHGCNTVVEVTCTGMGQNLQRLQDIARRTGLHIVSAAGFYYERWHPRWVREASPEVIEEYLLRQLVDGVPVEGGDPPVVRPGIVAEIGTSDPISPQEEKVLRAAARAARRAGVPLSTHAHLGSNGLRQLEILLEEGVPPHRIAIGHQDLLDDIDVHKAIASTGAYVQYDTVGKERYQSDDVRIRLVREMIEAGYGDRLMLSVDISRHAYLTSRGGHGYAYLFERFLPRLRGVGLDDAAIEALVRDNPRRFLGGDEA